MLSLNITRDIEDTSTLQKKKKLKWRERLKIRKEKRLKWKVRQATQKREVKKEIRSTNSHIKKTKKFTPASNVQSLSAKKPKLVANTDLSDKHLIKMSETKDSPSSLTKYTPTSSSLFTNNPEIPTLANLSVDDTGKDKLFDSLQFKDLPLAPHLLSNLEHNFGFKTMTSVQSLALPILLDPKFRKDMMMKSKTGSGKTLAYAIPIVNDLQSSEERISRSDGPCALVVTPTRELAIQVYQVFQMLTKCFNWIVPGCIVGGEKRKSEKARLRKGVNILVATPGRLLDHIEHTECLSLTCVRWLVLDEADRLMEMGFVADVTAIVEELNRQNIVSSKRCNLLLSATLDNAVDSLITSSLRDPLYIDATATCPGVGGVEEQGGGGASKSQTPSQLLHYYTVVPAKLRLVTLAAFVKHVCQDLQQKAVVFLISKQSVEFHHALLKANISHDLSVYQLHGSMKQDLRLGMYSQFCRQKSAVLLCTDVAARGLDLLNVNWIIQYSPPCQAADYVHRVGRTARAGAGGQALLFLMPHEADYGILLNKTQGISISSLSMEDILQHLTDEKGQSKSQHTVATDLQMKFERSLLNDPDLMSKAKAAYQSYIRGYTTYGSDVKHLFNVKLLHLGHIAKAFALRQPPTAILSSSKVGSVKKTNTKHANFHRKRHSQETPTGRKFNSIRKVKRMKI